MKSSKVKKVSRHVAAVVGFFDDMADYRDTRRRAAAAKARLDQRTKESPEMVVSYLDSLEEGVEERSVALRDLRKKANAALVLRAQAAFK